MKEGWKYKRLGDIATYVNGFAFKPCDWENKGRPIIRIQNLTDNTAHCNRCLRTDIPDKYKVVKGDVLISWSATLGVFEWDREDAWLNQHIFKVVFDKTSINKKYFEYVVESSLEEMSRHTNGATMQHIRKGDFDNIVVPVPSLSQQQEIVDSLDTSFAKIDAMKANAEKSLDEAKALFQSSLKELLKPKDGWEEKTVCQLAVDIYRGSGIRKDQVVADGISCVRYGEIYTKYNYHFDKCHSHTLTEYVPSPKYFEHGDIIFAITGESVEDIGKCAAYVGDEKCIAGGDTVVLKHNQEPRYLAYALSTPSAVKQKGRGKTKLKVVHTNIPSLKEIVLPIAPMAEQILIADTLDTIQLKVDQLQANYDKISQECDALKQSILKQVFE